MVDSRLSHLAQTGKTQSGCTAVTAFLRIEHLGEENKGFTNPGLKSRGLMEGRGEEELEAQTSLAGSRGSIGGGTSGATGGAAGSAVSSGSVGRKVSGRRIRDFVRGLTGSGGDKKEDEEDDEAPMVSAADGSRVEAIEPKNEKGLRRVLYTANVGDARGVLWWVRSMLSELIRVSRGGKAVRLTYDHKGSDTHEAKRITDAGGFVMNNRVNGEIALCSSVADQIRCAGRHAVSWGRVDEGVRRRLAIHDRDHPRRAGRVSHRRV